MLNNEEMGQVEGGFSFSDLFSAVTTSKATTPTKVDPFMDNMKKMFGASAGRDLAKVAQKYGLVDVVNSIFGWK